MDLDKNKREIKRLLKESAKIKDDIVKISTEAIKKRDIEISTLKQKVEDYRNNLEDVVNELELSGDMIEKHGSSGTPVSELVRAVLDEKDLKTACLKRGFKEIKPPSKER